MAVLSGQKALAEDPEINRPSVSLVQISGQSIANTTNTAITFTGEIVDTHGWHSTSVNTTRVTPTVAGYYLCIGQVAWTANTTGDRSCKFRKNGSALDGAPYGSAAALNGAAFLHGTVSAMAVIQCNGATDYIELWATQNSGGALSTVYVSTDVSSVMTIFYMHS